MRALVVLVAFTAVAHAAPAEDDISPRTIVFARGDKLIKADARGKGESTLVTLAAKRAVRALRTDAQGKVLLADLGGTWSFMLLDGGATALTDLPCEAGPAQLSNDGQYVLCRGKTGSIVFNTKTAKITPIDVPTAGARLTGAGNELRIVWADAQGVWSAVPPQRKQPTKVVPQPPLRSLIISPDGKHGVGVYTDEIFDGPRTKKTADVLMMFSLDGSGARRNAIQNGVPLEWSHDSRWVLVQDGRSACVMLAAGGQYKCWRGYTAAALSPDGKYALLFGNRDMPVAKKAQAKKGKKDKRSKKGKKSKKAPVEEPMPDAEAAEDEQPGEAPSDEASDDVPLAPPGGPVALYRAEIDGAFTKSPQLVTRDVAGAAVWIPAVP